MVLLAGAKVRSANEQIMDELTKQVLTGVTTAAVTYVATKQGEARKRAQERKDKTIELERFAMNEARNRLYLLEGIAWDLCRIGIAERDAKAGVDLQMAKRDFATCFHERMRPYYQSVFPLSVQAYISAESEMNVH